MTRTTRATTLRDNNILNDGPGISPMPWVLAILLFITVLAAAAGLSVGAAAINLSNDLAHRLTVQIIEANPDLRHAQASEVARKLKQMDQVESAEIVDDQALDQLVSPWLGKDGVEAGLPYPALVDVTLRAGHEGGLEQLKTALNSVAPSARIEPDAQWLGPLAQLLAVTTWFAGAIVVLMMVAVAAAVMLSARAALNTHRSTIDILHLMGSSDSQIAKLFQRRIVVDAAISGAIGLVGAVVMLWVTQLLLASLRSEFLGAAFMPWWVWLVLPLLPLMATLVANLAARISILRALKTLL